MSGHTPSELVAQLRERSLQLSGRSIDRGCQDSGISANLCDAAADLIAANEAKIEALTMAVTKAHDELAALVADPDKPSLESWPVSNRGDQECLQIAYRTLRAALTSAGEK